MLGQCPEIRGNDTGEPDRALAMNFPNNQKFAAARYRRLPGIAWEWSG